jgi:dTDP-4-dehydrorhamnose 3,5-epimerase
MHESFGVREKIVGKALAGVRVFQQEIFYDPRGDFSPTIDSRLLEKAMRPGFMQLNTAFSVRNVLRGMHRQDQTKMVMPVRGEIFDVVLEPETGNWCALRMSYGMAMLIPPQYAHGYLVLSDDAVVQYFVDAPYSPEDEETFRWDGYGIGWPLSIIPSLSEKDLRAPVRG